MASTTSTALPVVEDFVYSSDRNDDWLDGERLHAMLREVEAVA